MQKNISILNFLTEGHCEIWQNLLRSLERVGLKDAVKVYALDTAAHECAKSLGVNTIFIDAGTQSEADCSEDPSTP